MLRRRTIRAVSVHDQPVTASVIRWAITESGYTVDDLDERLHVAAGTARLWGEGDGQPHWNPLQALVRVFKRPDAMFFLPGPPEAGNPPLQIRGPPRATPKKT